MAWPSVFSLLALYLILSRKDTLGCFQVRPAQVRCEHFALQVGLPVPASFSTLVEWTAVSSQDGSPE